MADYVLVLIAAPGRDAVLARAAEALPRDRGIDWSPVTRLGRTAVEAPFSVAGDGAAAGAVRARVALEFASEPVDVCVVRMQHRRKRLIVADMDSTIIGQECIDEMADMAGLKPQIAAITERAMRGELAFEEALRARLSLLRGLAEADLERVWRERVRLNPGARTLLATMRANGARAVLVSGGFTFFTERVAAAAGFDAHHANTLEVVDGRLTGQVVGPILGREAKLATLEQVAREMKLVQAETLAVGDGANDLAMIGAAGLGVAYRAKPIVAIQAHAAIDHGDLTALLYLQGYREAEFTRADGDAATD
jgi:phosphoserine phosphatase